MKLPNILSFHLNRFEFDLNNSVRKKICDKFIFPFVLDMNSLLNNNNSNNLNEKYNGNSKFNFGEFKEENYANNSEDVSKDNIAKFLKNGPYVYELYAIVIHSGSFSGGHYYVYIKSFEDGKWYNFNDKEVDEIDISDIDYTYGSNESKGVSLNTGYMLMYRRCFMDTGCNRKIYDSMIKKELYYDILEENEKLEEEDERKKRDKCPLVNIQLNYNNITNVLTVKENILIKAFKLHALRAFSLSNIHPCRVRIKYSYKHTNGDNASILPDNMVRLLIIFLNSIHSL